MAGMESIISTTTHHTPVATDIDPSGLTLPGDADTATTPSVRRAMWPLAGVVAGVAGLCGGMVAMGNSVSEERARLGIDAIDELDRGPYHLAFVFGIITTIALIVAGAGWNRWAEERGHRRLGARVIGVGFAATAAVHLVGTTAAGSMSLYLPGGPNEGFMSREGLLVSYTLLDFGLLMSFWGVLVGALGVATLSFGRRRVLPRWMGVVSTVLVLLPLATAVGMALPGLPGFFMPIWLTIISVGMIFSRTARA
jgi:hypothetical protein